MHEEYNKKQELAIMNTEEAIRNIEKICGNCEYWQGPIVYISCNGVTDGYCVCAVHAHKIDAPFALEMHTAGSHCQNADECLFIASKDAIYAALES